MHHADRAGPGQLSLLGPEIPLVAEQVVKEADIPVLVDMAYNDPQTIGNPRDLTKRSYEQIYRSCFGK
jgi:choline dehydrogenase